ncbi:MAG: hypothetical protein ACTSW1_04005 [Candidatus Hodarchaeales archaeon]
MSETRKPFLEAAKSGRAKCRGCQEKINKGEVRVALPYSFTMKDGREIETYRYYHIRCVPPYKVSSVLEILQETEFLDFKKLEIIKKDLEAARSKQKQKVSTNPYIEISPSSRATCKICKEKIIKGEFRVSKPLTVELEDGRIFQRKTYYHFKCYLSKEDNFDLVVNNLVEESIKRKLVDEEELKKLVKSLDMMKNSKKQADDFLSLLNKDPKSFDELKRIGKEFGLDESKLRQILEEKINSGEIFQLKPGFYQKL